MKALDIQAGRFYHDGKQGVREVLAVTRDEVRYRLLAAKQTQTYDSRQGVMVSLIGADSRMTLGAFATWAKTGHDRAGIDAVLLRLQAATVKLSPGERAFVRPALDDRDARGPLPVAHTEGRAVAGLVRKGLLVRDGAQATLTPLGHAWVERERATTTDA